MGNQNASDRDMLEHAWRYFALHAGQRMSIFNFFLVLSGLVAAGLATCLQRDKPFQLLGTVLGFLLALVSFTFWKLDQRTSFFIKHAEGAIAELEESFPLAAARLISRERHRTDAAVSSSFVLIRMWTYGSAFRLIFVVMGIVGLGGAAWSLCRYVDWIK